MKSSRKKCISDAKRILHDSPAWQAVLDGPPQRRHELPPWLTPSGVADFVYRHGASQRTEPLGAGYGRLAGKRMHDQLFAILESNEPAPVPRDVAVDESLSWPFEAPDPASVPLRAGYRITANPDGTTETHLIAATEQDPWFTSPARLDLDCLDELEDGLDNLLQPHDSRWLAGFGLLLIAILLGALVQVIRLDIANYGVPFFPFHWSHLQEPAWLAVVILCGFMIRLTNRRESSRLERLGTLTYVGSTTAPLLANAKHRVRGRPDLIVKRGHRYGGLRGNHYPVEYKTTQRPTTPHAHDIAQLAAYGLLVKAHHGRYPGHGYLIYADGEPIKINLAGAKHSILRIMQAMRDTP